jgi:hypothetical protein
MNRTSTFIIAAAALALTTAGIGSASAGGVGPGSTDSRIITLHVPVAFLPDYANQVQLVRGTCNLPSTIGPRGKFTLVERSIDHRLAVGHFYTHNAAGKAVPLHSPTYDQFAGALDCPVG